MVKVFKNDNDIVEKDLQSAMSLIIDSGNAKSYATEAIRAAKKGDMEIAQLKLKDAQKSLINAHNSQTEMLTQEAKGNHTNITLLTIHSQDHLMTAITYCDLASELVDIYTNLNGGLNNGYK